MRRLVLLVADSEAALDVVEALSEANVVYLMTEDQEVKVVPS